MNAHKAMSTAVFFASFGMMLSLPCEVGTPVGAGKHEHCMCPTGHTCSGSRCAHEIGDKNHNISGYSMSKCHDCSCKVTLTGGWAHERPWVPADGLIAMPGISPCKWVDFRGRKDMPMCVHPGKDIISDHIANKFGFWRDCNMLVGYWKRSKSKLKTHLEIGANIGACVMEMLASTDADIVAFEPNPANLFRLTSTLSKLSPEFSRRVTLYPMGLGDTAGEFNIYAAKDNYGNSVIGKQIRDGGRQQFDEPVKVQVRTLDSVIPKSLKFRIVKMDVQGFECKVLDGAKTTLGDPHHSFMMKTEVADRFLIPQNCSGAGLYSRLTALGYEMHPSKVPAGHGDAIGQKPLKTTAASSFGRGGLFGS